MAARRDRRLPDGSVLPGWAVVAEVDRGAGVVAWDGRVYRVAQEVSALPQGLLRLLDRSGRCVRVRPELLLPMADLGARFVLRVPWAHEVAHLDPARIRCEREVLRRPAFLVDGRAALSRAGLAAGVEVIDDPAEAVAVLSRLTAAGVYLPTLPPSTLAETPLATPAAPYGYRVGVWPA